ncbi:MAG TPA: alpha/beta fold hydrolase [Gemmatimonadaceae bacterium]|nr:alpha/beta fold hydrolase [Gemmatimonadaceae bacterium]
MNQGGERSAIYLLMLLTSIACASQQPPNQSPLGRDPAPAAKSPATNSHAVTLATSSGNLAGTLQLPSGRTPVPVVLIIAGSGPTDRDGNTPALPGSNNSLKLLAEGLAGRGLASLRYDKRGVGGSASAATRESELRFTNYVDDAAAWIRHLRSDRRFSTLTVIGHSEGSLIGMIAAKQAGADAFVSIAGAGRRPQDIITEQLSAQLPVATVNRAKEIMKQIETGGKPDSIPPVLAPLFRPSVQPYLVSWFKFDPTAEIAGLTIPAMVVQGTTDLQITQEDARRLAAAYPAATMLTVEGMNHVMKKAPAGRQEQMMSYMDPSMPVVPSMLDGIAAFVRGVARKKA